MHAHPRTSTCISSYIDCRTACSSSSVFHVVLNSERERCAKCSEREPRISKNQSSCLSRGHRLYGITYEGTNESKKILLTNQESTQFPLMLMCESSRFLTLRLLVLEFLFPFL